MHSKSDPFGCLKLVIGIHWSLNMCPSEDKRPFCLHEVILSSHHSKFDYSIGLNRSLLHWWKKTNFPNPIFQPKQTFFIMAWHMIKVLKCPCTSGSKQLQIRAFKWGIAQVYTTKSMESLAAKFESLKKIHFCKVNGKKSRCLKFDDQYFLNPLWYKIM